MTNAYFAEGAELAELDARLGPVPMLSLSQRGLLLAPGQGISVSGAPGLASRVTGALVGAAVGHALGAAQTPRGVARAAVPGPETAAGAEIALLAWSAATLLEHGSESAPALAERLRHALPFQRTGNALPAVLERLASGAPWFEAGVASIGSGAVVRAVAAGVVLRDRPRWRTLLAGLDAAVTHASVDAVSVSAATADLVAALLALSGAQSNPLAILDDVIARLAPGAGRAALEHARQRLARDDRPPHSGPRAIDALAASAWHALRHLRAPAAALHAAVRAHGVVDTVAALTGAFVGAANGIEAIPEDWRRASAASASLAVLAARICPVAAPQTPSRQQGEAASDGVHVSFLLDRSGSMQSIAGDVIGGFDAFLREQQAQPGVCRMTLVQFDSQEPFEVLADDADVRDVPPLDAARYQPRGMTPLLDAIGALLDHAERRAQAGRDEDQVVVVFTDGQENASRRWTRDALFGRMARLRAVGWSFVFLGANQDSYAESGSLGIGAGNTSNWFASPDGAADAFRSVGRAMSSYRAKPRAERDVQRDDFFEGTKEAEMRRRRGRNRLQ